MADLTYVWQKAQDYLKDRLGESVFATWVQPLKTKQKAKDALCLEAPDAFFKEWVERNYRQSIEEALNTFSPDQKISVSLEIGPQGEPPGKTSVTPSGQPSPPEKPLLLNLNDRYTFENFVEGPSNKHALAYSLAVAKSPAKAYNPLFIYGGVGLGKTHLIQAVCHYILKNNSQGLKIAYVSSEKFTNELIDAIQRHSTASFRQRYRNVGVLVIDDIHFIAGKESTQEEFFHTFNALYDAHRQIVFS